MESLEENKVCAICLVAVERLLPISEGNLSRYWHFYIQQIGEFTTHQIQNMVLRICVECIAMLRKILSFIDQIKNSYKLLQSFACERPTFLPRLSQCALEPIEIPPCAATPLGSPLVKAELSPVPPSPPSACASPWDSDGNQRHLAEYKPQFDEPQWALVKNPEEHLKRKSKRKHKSCPSLDKAKKEKLECLENLGERLKAKSKKKHKSCSPLGNANKKQGALKSEVEGVLRAGSGAGAGAGRCRAVQVTCSYEEAMAARAHARRSELLRRAPHACRSCLLQFATRAQLAKHARDHHTKVEGGVECEVCSCWVVGARALQHHYRRHLRAYRCALCTHTAPRLANIRAHWATEHATSDEHATADSAKPGTDKGAMAVQDERREGAAEETGHGRRRVPCALCDKTFAHRAALNNHHTSVHLRRNHFPCPEPACRKTFRWRASLATHQRAAHGGPAGGAGASGGAGPACEPCGVRFGSVWSLRRHLATSVRHVPEAALRYCCDECGRRYANKTKLRDHITSQHLRTELACPVAACPRRSRTRAALAQHVRSVHRAPHATPRYVCHACARPCATRAQLDSHLRTHTGERPYICHRCPATFAHRSNLSKHARQVHGVTRAGSDRAPVCTAAEAPAPLAAGPHVPVGPPLPPLHSAGFTTLIARTN